MLYLTLVECSKLQSLDTNITQVDRFQKLQFNNHPVVLVGSKCAYSGYQLQRIDTESGTSV